MFKRGDKVIYCGDIDNKNPAVYIVSKVRSSERVDLAYLDGSPCVNHYNTKYLLLYRIKGEQLLFSFMSE